MDVDFESILHPRILKHCASLYTSGHYKHAALEAMMQAELALKEKSEVKDKFGVNLVTHLFGENKGIKLRVPFGDEMQKQAETLFRGAFAYYRNYCAHGGSQVDSRTSLRVMVLASELLDLVGASQLSFADIGGIEGLIRAHVFSSAKSVSKLLGIVDGVNLPDDQPDWLDDRLMDEGYTLSQVQALIDIGLIEYVSQDFIVPVDLKDYRDTLPDTIGWFKLTKLGEEISVTC